MDTRLQCKEFGLRHVLRCAMAVLAALAIASLSGINAITATFLTATFAIMQPTQLGTAAKALQRTAGAILRVCIVDMLAFEQLLDLDDAVDSEHVTAGVRRSTNYERNGSKIRWWLKRWRLVRPRSNCWYQNGLSMGTGNAIE